MYAPLLMQFWIVARHKTLVDGATAKGSRDSSDRVHFQPRSKDEATLYHGMWTFY